MLLQFYNERMIPRFMFSGILLLNCISFGIAIQTCKVDLGIILDESNSILPESNFKNEKSFSLSVISKMNIGKSSTRVSYMSFSNQPRLKIKFNDNEATDQDLLELTVNGYAMAGGKSAVVKALDLARADMFSQASGQRKDFTKVLIVFTDGKSDSSDTKLQKASEKLASEDVNVIAVGVGEYINQNGLKLIATDDARFVYEMGPTKVQNDYIINKIIKTICAEVTCHYTHCQYSQWSSWSVTCGTGTTARTREVIDWYQTSSKFLTGCAGLPKRCKKKQTETKTLQTCSQTCNYVECEPGQWSSWSATCGNVERRRPINTVGKTTQQKSCDGLPISCYKKEENETKKLRPCPIDGGVSSWSIYGLCSKTCGNGVQTRARLCTNPTPKNGGRFCDKPLTETRTCKIKECPVDGGVSSWSMYGLCSKTCGNGVQTRARLCTNPTPKNGGRFCNEPLTETRTCKIKDCPVTCKYVECEPDQWSAWSATCGNVERTRTMNTIDKTTTQQENCDGLTTTCDKKEEKETKTFQPCLIICNYVKCIPLKWSAWSTTCGKDMTRSRGIDKVTVSEEKENCAGLPTTCDATETQTKTKLCSCTYAKCDMGEWTDWDVTCGDMTRSRSVIETTVTEQLESCNGLPPPKCVVQQESDTKFLCCLTWTPVGCYLDDMINPRPLPDYIYPGRGDIEWPDWDYTYKKTICTCATKAKQMGYTYFSEQNYGECWSGKDAGSTYDRNGPTDACVNGDFTACAPGELYCMGVNATNYVYRFDE